MCMEYNRGLRTQPWVFFSGVKDVSGRGVSTHPQNRESAKQEVKDPHAQ